MLSGSSLASMAKSEMFAMRTEAEMGHRPVRSLSRGLALIRELNVTGPSSVQQLAARTGLHRTTCYRLLETLRQDGLVTPDEQNGLFGLTARVRMLSEGVSTRDLS